MVMDGGEFPIGKYCIATHCGCLTCRFLPEASIYMLRLNGDYFYIYGKRTLHNMYSHYAVNK